MPPPWGTSSRPLNAIREKKVGFLALMFHYLTAAGWQQAWNKLAPYPRAWK